MTAIAHSGGPARLLYLGSPAIAVEPLRALVAAGHDIALVVTNPDRRRGRGGEPTPTPVKAAAVELGLTVSHDLDDALHAGADFGVVVAYGHLIGPQVLAAVPMLNIHFSLLPRWRGAAPLERAILAGDDETGVCLMEVVDELDAGRVYAREVVPIGERSLDELRGALVDVSCRLLVESLERGLGEPTPQVGDPVYAAKLSAADFELDFGLSAVENSRIVRLGRAHTLFRGNRLGVLGAAVDSSAAEVEPGTLDHERVATADGWLVLESVKPEGKPAMPAADWLRGARLQADERLGR